MKKHLEADEVGYTTRPLTVFERSIEIQLSGLDEKHPMYYQLWTIFLWSRQDEVLPKELFADILVTDWVDHQNACIHALDFHKSERELLKILSDSWRFDFRERSWDRDKLEEWSSRNV